MRRQTTIADARIALVCPFLQQLHIICRFRTHHVRSLSAGVVRLFFVSLEHQY